ncbi:MAG TPA: CHAT domain-containing tetratricopeptide repeat protein [Thermoanaerobaculia bacterium]|nr:CHAT domain-containing tetratricopeptide repeat protein [Thermoanaerobaculia bacterium]
MPESALALAPGARAEARLAGGQAHAYRLTLAAARFYDLVVEQHGVDVVVSLLTPDGQLITRVDSPNGTNGPEPLPLLADSTGSYHLLIAAADARSAPGLYRIVIHADRPATARDRRMVGAERTFAAAEELRRRGLATTLQAAVPGEQRALAQFRALGEQRREADVLYALGRLHSSLGDRAVALGFFGHALADFRRLGETSMAAKALNSIGQAHRSLGEMEDALDCERDALALHRRLGERWEEAITLNDLGRIYASLDAVEKALSYYGQALALWRELGDRGNEGLTLSNTAELYGSLGQPQRALDDLDRALPLLREAGRQRDIAIALARRGVALALGDRPREGLAPLQEGLRIQQEAGDRHEEGVTLNNLGWLYRHLGEVEQARRRYNAALGIFRTLGDRQSQAGTLTNLGWIECEGGDARGAATHFDQALALFRAVGDREGEAAAALGTATALRRLGKLEMARAAVELAIARIEVLRAEPASKELRSSFFAWKHDYYSFYIDLLMQLQNADPAAGYDARALAASEAMRARSLLELLAEVRANLKHRVGPRLLAREAELADRLQAAERQRQIMLERGDPDRLLEPVERRIRGLLGDHERLEAEMRLANPRYAALTRPQPLSLEAIQHQILDRDTLLLEYALGEDHSYLWVVSRDGLQSFMLAPQAVIEQAARRAYGLLAARSPALARVQTAMALADLSHLLLAPAGGRLYGKRLLIVADGALHYIPFAALPEPGLATAAGPQPLAVGHEIVTLPSASILASLAQPHAGQPWSAASVAVVADPVFNLSDPRLDQRPAAAGATAAQSPDPPGAEPRFKRLLYSHDEAKAILALVPAARRLAALDFAASRELVMSGRLGRYRIVHVATHGVFDATHPELSGLVFSQVDEHGRPRDGTVRAHEIYQLDFAADLVVLSACQTALGREIRGEGLVGLTRGFLYAGARRVLVSLWAVEDRATTELMRHFYLELLKNGRPPAAALRTAQLAVARQGRWREPYYWAGFVLQGDWR